MALVLAGMTSYGFRSEAGKFVVVRRGQAAEAHGLSDKDLEHLRQVVTRVRGNWMPAFVQIDRPVAQAQRPSAAEVKEAEAAAAEEAARVEAEADAALAKAKAAEEARDAKIAEDIAAKEAKAKETKAAEADKKAPAKKTTAKK